MNNAGFNKMLFLVAALYDGILGLGFFIGYQSIYSMLNITLPENPAYIHLAAALVFVQGVGYYFVYRNMERNADIVRQGIIYKVAYSGVAFYYWARGGLPHPIFGVLGILDLCFLLLFARYLQSARPAPTPS
ncbi:MAG: hypothetical protein ACREJQ_04385 [bacterium]